MQGFTSAAALATVLMIAACDQNSDEQAAGEAGEEIAAGMPEGDMPESAMPGTAMPESQMPVDDVIAGDDPDDAAAACQAAADALGGVWVGRPCAEAEEAVMAGEGVATIRVIHPGTAVTKDFRVDRLNVDVDESGNVTRIYCG